MTDRIKAEEGSSRFMMGRSDYEEIIMLARTATTPATRITVQLYYYMLTVLPPGYARGMNGFYMSEMLTSCPLGDVTVQVYNPKEGEYYAKYVILQAPETWITPNSIINAHPVDPIDYVGYA